MNVIQTMMWALIATIVVLFISSCNDRHEVIGTIPANETSKYPTKCIDGVLYYSGYSGRLAPAFNRDSTVKLCGDDLDEN